MSRSNPLTLTAAVLAALGAALLLGLTPARALDLDDLDDLPPIRRIIPMPAPTGPVIVIPIDVDD
jgi:hypothetical protein